MAHTTPRIPPPVILDYITQHLTYDPRTGVIMKGNRAFGFKRKDNNLWIITIIIPNKDGTSILYKAYAHQIAWYLSYKEWPLQWLGHKDGNGADNRLSNLFLTDSKEVFAKARAKKPKRGISQYHGVSWCSDGRKHWRAHITYQGKYISIGRYQTEKEAAIAYNQWAPKYGLPLNVIVDVLEEPTPNVLAPEVAPPTEIPTQE